MTTNYDPIAEQYQLSKQQVWRSCIEAYSLLKLLGDINGKTILDVACGEGFYTRQLRQRGAAEVTGVDLSAGMIDLARRQELQHQLGIEYMVGDARHLECAGARDLVVAAYLLNYAQDRGELQAMCDGLAGCLRPGGRFVTVNSSPALDFPIAPSYCQYGFEVVAGKPWQEGAPITWTFQVDSGEFSIENYFLSLATHEAAFKSAGFREVNWHAPQLSPEAAQEYDVDFWATFLRHPPIALIECIR